MRIFKKCCLNCIHCDTFSGICIKNKFKIISFSKLEEYNCKDCELSIKCKVEGDKQ